MALACQQLRNLWHIYNQYFPELGFLHTSVDGNLLSLEQGARSGFFATLEKPYNKQTNTREVLAAFSFHFGADDLPDVSFGFGTDEISVHENSATITNAKEKQRIVEYLEGYLAALMEQLFVAVDTLTELVMEDLRNSDPESQDGEYALFFENQFVTVDITSSGLVINNNAPGEIILQRDIQSFMKRWPDDDTKWLSSYIKTIRDLSRWIHQHNIEKRLKNKIETEIGNKLAKN
ncbi:hypothetical protein KC686_00315 [Candidatus Woesebacteria bacterium]|nr:hypothetical protein [Candidatus Woesebacteria bacterium]